MKEIIRTKAPKQRIPVAPPGHIHKPSTVREKTIEICENCKELITDCICKES